MSKITDALAKLDPTNDNHWTSDGLPRIDTVKLLASDSTLTREMITAEVPNFTRQTAGQPVAPAPAPAPVQESAPQTVAVSDSGVMSVAEAPTNTSEEGAVVDYDQMIQQAQEELQKAISVRNEVHGYVAEKQDALDALINAKHAAGTTDSTMDVIQGYLRSQQNVLQERGRRAQVLKDSGVTLEDIKNLIPQASPLDQALARKR